LRHLERIFFRWDLLQLQTQLLDLQLQFGPAGRDQFTNAAFNSVARFSEHKLARRLPASLPPGMLLPADRNFAGHALWRPEDLAVSA
jgi:hypothetical protein